MSAITFAHEMLLLSMSIKDFCNKVAMESLSLPPCAMRYTRSPAPFCIVDARSRRKETSAKAGEGRTTMWLEEDSGKSGDNELMLDNGEGEGEKESESVE